jgi:hypothetical protein
MHLRRIPKFCVDVPKEFIKSDQVELTAAGQPLRGSYHVLVGARWILKIPACGTPTQFDSSASAAVRSEALIMRLIRRETSIPILEVFAFDTSLDNELGCPYNLMSFVEVIPLYDC